MKMEIKVPAMGESISEATVGTLLKANGSAVKADDEVLELETDKVNQVLYAPQAGTIEIQVQSGDVVKIGQVIGYVETDNAAQTSSSEPKKEEEEEKPQQEEKPKAESSAPRLPPPGPASSDVRITKENYISSLPSKEAAQPPPVKKEAPVIAPTGKREVTRKKLSNIRKVIAQRLLEAQQSTAMLTTFNEVDMSVVMELREKYKESFLKTHGTKLGFMGFFVKAVVSALKEVPQVNSFIEGDELLHRDYYDIGIAVGTERGVMVPVVKDCDALTLAGIEKAIEGFAKQAREGKIKVDDLQGGCFTITNGGVYGSLWSTPILNPPQSAILGMHKIEKRAVVVNEQIVIRPMMYLALSYDHRVIDGKEAVTFLVHIKNCLEDPARMLLEI